MQVSRPLKQGLAFSLLIHAVLFAWLWSIEIEPVTFQQQAQVDSAGPVEVAVTFFVQTSRPNPTPGLPSAEPAAVQNGRQRRTQASMPSGGSTTDPPAPTDSATRGQPSAGPTAALPQVLTPTAPTGNESAPLQDVPRLATGQPSSNGQLTLTPSMSFSAGGGSTVPRAITRMSDVSLDRVQRQLPGVLTEAANKTQALFTPQARAQAMGHSLEATGSKQVRAAPGGKRSRTPVALQAEQAPGPSGAVDLQRAATSLATLRSFSEGAATPTWSLQLELLASGGDVRVALRRASSFPALDVMVQQRARLWVAERRQREPDFMEGIRRSLWQVDAFVHYRQDLSDTSAADLVGLIATAPITGMGKGRTADKSQTMESRIVGLALTVNVDETTGKTEAVNLGSPQYRLELRLLESELESEPTDGGV